MPKFTDFATTTDSDTIRSDSETTVVPEHLGNSDIASIPETKSSLSSCKLGSQSSIEDDFECREGQMDPVRFRSAFFQTMEELRMRRSIDVENDRRIKQLLAENQDLQKRVEEQSICRERLIEQHSQIEQDMKRDYDEKINFTENDKVKTRITAENWENELKALKNEIRILQLLKYNLEKKVTEQERQLHLQTYSKDTYLLQTNELNQKCSAILKQAEDIAEQIEKLDTNVRCLKDIHLKLQYVNEHQKCELEVYRNRLEDCRANLIETRARSTEKQQSDFLEGNTAVMKVTDQNLRMKTELNKQLQKQLACLRNEHLDVLRQLKKAHSLVERHVQSLTTATANEAALRMEGNLLTEKVKELKCQLDDSVTVGQAAKEKLIMENCEWSTKYADIEARLKSLQEDYTTLQKTFEMEFEVKDSRLKGAVFAVTQLEMEVKCLKEQLNSMKQDDEQSVCAGLAGNSECTKESNTEFDEKDSLIRQQCLKVPSPPTINSSPDILTGSSDTIRPTTVHCKETQKHLSPISFEENLKGIQEVIESRMEPSESEMEMRESFQKPLKRPSTSQESTIKCPLPKKIRTQDFLSQKEGGNSVNEHTQSISASIPASQTLEVLCGSTNSPLQDPSELSKLDHSEQPASDLMNQLVSKSEKPIIMFSPPPDQSALESKLVEANTAIEQQLQEADECSITFSDEDGGSDGDGRLLNTQLKNQINKVQMFLKLDKLRRPKK